MAKPSSRVARWIYQRLLLAYPESFRRRFGDGMTELFAARHQRAAAKGVLARMFFWLRTVGDVLETAGVERLESWRSAPRRPRPRKELPLETFYQDLKLAVRRMIDAPGFTLAALLIIGLGVGVNIAMFGLVEGILFRPPPWEEPEQLVWVYQDSDDGEPNSCSFPAYRDIRAYHDIFSGVAAFIPTRPIRYLSPEGDARLVTANYSTSSLFPVLGLTPARGRWFDDEADEPGAEPVGVVSYDAWRRHFGSDPDIVGSTVRLSGASVTIVGVGPKGYGGEMSGLDTDFWLSLSAAGPVGGDHFWTTMERREDHWFLVLARMHDDVNTSQTQEAMNALEARLASEYPDLNEGRSITVFPADRVRLHPEYDAFLFPAGGVLLAVSGIVLLIACGNLANLLLARASARGREIAVRLSMGATRSRLVRQLLTESVILSIGGGAVGLLFAFWIGRAASGLPLPAELPMSLDLPLDTRMLSFTAALSLATGLVFGLAPALRASRPNLVPSLKDGDPAASFGQRHRRRFTLRDALVSMQVAMSMVLLIGAGLLIRSLINAETVDLGFGHDRLAVLEADAGEADYEGERRRTFFRRLAEQTRELEGVQSVSLTTRLPATDRGGSSTLEIEDYEGKAEVVFAAVDIDYFETLRIPFLDGRGFERADLENDTRVAIINEAFAKRYWGSSDGVGRRYRHEGDPDSWVRVVGVVGDTKVRTPHESPTPIVYRPLMKGFNPSRLFVVARTDREPEPLAGRMRHELRSIDANVPVYRAGTMDEHVALALGMPRAAAITLGLLGALAVLLASVGLYAVVSFSVSRRTSEIGVRLALGASGLQVIASVVKHTMWVAGVGAAIGLVLALFAMPVLGSILFDVTASDPATFGAVALVMMIVVSLAAYLPARHAVSTDPVKALRMD